MHRRAIFISLAIPLFGGGLIGYSLGHMHHEGPPPGPALEAHLYSEGGSATDQESDSARHDSLNAEAGSSRRNAITRTVASVSPAVVGINVTEVRQYRYQSPWGEDPFFRRFFGDQTFTQRVQGLGSGFIISPDGYILTNDHVAGNAKEITVTVTSGEKYKAELVGTDQVSDISLLRISGKNLPWLRLGNSDDVIIGEWAIAFGNPFGLFDISDRPTVTVGVVSAVGMNLQQEEGRSYRGMIQTDAAINPGNSGGPLLDSHGNVIGINTAIFGQQGSIGIGCAMPINRAKSMLEEFQQRGHISRPSLGIRTVYVAGDLAGMLELPSQGGLLIQTVERGSAAEGAGLRGPSKMVIVGGFQLGIGGDLILAADGQNIEDNNTLPRLLNRKRGVDMLELTIYRNGQTQKAQVKLGEAPQQL